MSLCSGDHPFDLYKDEYRTLIYNGAIQIQEVMSEVVGYRADQNYKEERTYIDKKGLISAFSCNN